MKKLVLAVCLLSLAGTAMAAGKPCDELKADLDAKLQAKGIKSYSLEVVAKGSAADNNKVIGSCDAGTKEIVYKRG